MAMTRDSILRLSKRAVQAARTYPRAIAFRALDALDLLELYADLRFGVQHRKAYGRYPYWGFRRFRVPEVGDVGIVFYCGLGDALYGLSTLREIAKQLRSENRRFVAYTMKATDQFNNSGLQQFLESTGLFDGVTSFQGQATEYWKYYDWSSLVSQVPESTVVRPFIYSTRRRISHRIDAVRKQFSLSRGQREIPLDIRAPTNRGREVVKALRDAGKVVFLHCDARSSGYTYPHAKELAGSLIDRGHTVASFTRINGLDEEKYQYLAPEGLSLYDTAHILREIGAPAIALNSVLWPLGLATKTPLLGLHYLKSRDGHHFYYDGMRFVSSMEYCVDRVSNGILARRGIDFDDNKDHPRTMIDYRPASIMNWVADCGW